MSDEPECTCPIPGWLRWSSRPDEPSAECPVHAAGAKYAALCRRCTDRMSEHEDGFCLTCEDWGGPCST